MEKMKSERQREYVDSFVNAREIRYVKNLGALPFGALASSLLVIMSDDFFNVPSAVLMILFDIIIISFLQYFRKKTLKYLIASACGMLINFSFFMFVWSIDIFYDWMNYESKATVSVFLAYFTVLLVFGFVINRRIITGKMIKRKRPSKTDPKKAVKISVIVGGILVYPVIKLIDITMNKAQKEFFFFIILSLGALFFAYVAVFLYWKWYYLKKFDLDQPLLSD